VQRKPAERGEREGIESAADLVGEHSSDLAERWHLNAVLVQLTAHGTYLLIYRQTYTQTTHTWTTQRDRDHRQHTALDAWHLSQTDTQTTHSWTAHTDRQTTHTERERPHTQVTMHGTYLLIRRQTYTQYTHMDHTQTQTTDSTYLLTYRKTYTQTTHRQTDKPQDKTTGLLR